MFLFVFWRNLTTPKNLFEINWPLVRLLMSRKTRLKYIFLSFCGKEWRKMPNISQLSHSSTLAIQTDCGIVWNYQSWIEDYCHDLLLRSIPRTARHPPSFPGKLKLVFCYQNCSDLLWEKIVLVITRTICSNSERSEQFLVTECFFNLFLEVSHI